MLGNTCNTKPEKKTLSYQTLLHAAPTAGGHPHPGIQRDRLPGPARSGDGTGMAKSRMEGPIPDHFRQRPVYISTRIMRNIYVQIYILFDGTFTSASAMERGVARLSGIRHGCAGVRQDCRCTGTLEFRQQFLGVRIPKEQLAMMQEEETAAVTEELRVRCSGVIPFRKAGRCAGLSLVVACSARCCAG